MIEEEHFHLWPQASSVGSKEKRSSLPSWLHLDMPRGMRIFKTGELLKKHRLHTVCDAARCPNRLHCYSRGTATFLALGNRCTRSCSFCHIDFSSKPLPPEADEPARIAAAVLELQLSHVVITMVARDDLPDGGADHLVQIVEEIRRRSPRCSIELLTSDFQGDHAAIDKVLDAAPDLFNHNLETVRILTPKVRHKATYDRSLALLNYAKERGREKLLVKSGLMVGLGESSAQVFETISDLQQVGCDMVTIGQYLQPDRRSLKVKEFISPEIFKEYEAFAHRMGIKRVYAGPFVRSSFHAEESFLSVSSS